MEQLKQVKQASRKLAQLPIEKINEVLVDIADGLTTQIPTILDANKKDLAQMETTNPKYDRLQLTKERLEDIAKDIRNIATMPSPIGEIFEQRVVPSGLELTKIRVPLGVVGVIYEARPNVTFDVFTLCFKTQNACVLKGGSDAKESNQAIVSYIKNILKKHTISEDILFLAPANREAVYEILQAYNNIDVIIPRGSSTLINFVREHAKVPVIETGAGIVHTYIDISADITKAQAIITNAKTRRVSVCNALDTLIIHQDKLDNLSEIIKPLAEKKVHVYADNQSFNAIKNQYPADLLYQAAPEDFGTEFLDYKMSIKTVSSIEEALEHIQQYSSKHSEAIIAEDQKAIELFLNTVDAAAVYANASTAFTDGAQFGLGAEIGISTQKLHARGPMGLKELTSYKWIVKGNGQIRT
ncbi:MAG: glutamate-5-semialdehyde dehydrogenase [Candidatus Magasanikbacteria bacterium]|uniref:Gamma-glutamyl phosphate reductase n=1 Tax=Candidatus Magasanikbacteria bacterium CG10_big_fil_rev_8_21_14_0_10_38_6 TaxID=1974647 RepID=A0A2M6P161_9BACT|nr:glutamate-5-semialdehyde dehydrogenase [Candidatus Magasanikbacteria bacterium]NCS72284.1 glutamate-5-semialdehyde dehydrogenase [Candidatus Magasanikbacteria bacterium]PIR77441.1 MAG: glutamate-5-semialdehyde dehydrogenase [Candidatus Magasanikbacteria bacterium CG10_big_fil_rev_8_21_14_0_10_38_6]